MNPDFVMLYGLALLAVCAIVHLAGVLARRRRLASTMRRFARDCVFTRRQAD